MRRLSLSAFALALVVLAAGDARARLPQPAPATDQASEILVLKGERRLILRRGGVEIAAYNIALGFAPEGHKARAGDGRTPEGRYVIDWRNPKSAFHLSLHISYPSTADAASASAAGHDPGGMIMIHGLPNGRGWIGGAHAARDWTEGCIAVTSEEIEEIWRLVPDGTPIEIRP